MKLNEKEQKILKTLVEHYDTSGWGEGGYFSFKSLARNSKVPLKYIRRNVRSLARKGLAEFQKCLVDCDGMMAGAGYGATKAGAVFLNGCIECKKEVGKMDDGRCDTCWRNRKCTSCGKSYDEHETDWEHGSLTFGYKKEFAFPE